MFQKLRNYTLDYYPRLIMNNPGLLKAVFLFLGLPIIRDIYHHFYQKRIKTVLENLAPERDYRFTVEPFNVCNLKCIMCPYPDMTREKTKMPMELFKSIVSQAADIGIRQLDFSHYNEVFLDDLFIDRIRYAKEKGLNVFTFSNGSKTKLKDIDPLLESGLDLIIFSIDGGTKQSFEEIRKGADFDKTVEIIQAIIKRRKERNLTKPAIHIHSTILSKENLNASQFLHKIFEGADNFSIGLVDSRGGQDSYRFAQSASSNGNKRRLYPCVSPFGELTVLSSGEVSLCCRDYDGSEIVGDLKKQTIQEVLNSKTLKDIQQLHLDGRGDEVEICKNCDALYRATLSWWRNG